MICFVGDSHAPRTLEAAAVKRGLFVTDIIEQATLVIVAQDTATDADGKRDLNAIRRLVTFVMDSTIRVPIILSSQVQPGFTRSLLTERVIHMAETLRIKDAAERALHPEQFVFGVAHGDNLPEPVWDYVSAFPGAIIQIMSYEEAEFSKIAINMMLAAQVDATNKLARAAELVGASWKNVSRALIADRRIGPHAYLEPGRWQDSTHLYRDYVTLEKILGG